MPGKWRLSAYIASVAVAIAAIPSTRAEILPTKGVFQGIYFQNRAGVGHFNFFIVSAELTKKLAPYNGKLVEIEVLRGIQPVNPGPAYMEAIGRVRELAPPPLKVHVNTVSPGASGTGTFDIVYSFVNAGSEPLKLNSDYVSIGLESFADDAGADGLNERYGGYTRRQLRYGGTTTQRWNFVDPMSPGHRTHFYTKYILFEPGQSVPFVWHSIARPAGEYEIVVSARLYTGTEEPEPILCRQPLDLPLVETAREAPDGLEIRATIVRSDEWLVVDGRLVDQGDAARHIFVKPDQKRFFLGGLVQLEDPSGKPFAVDLDWNDPYSGPWIRKKIGTDGIAFHFRIRQADHFRIQQEARLGFWIVTEAGIAKLTISDELPELPSIPNVVGGEPQNGCRLRIRMPRTKFATNEAPRFHFEVESDGKSAEILWLEKGDAKVEIDGKPAKLYTSQLIDRHVLQLPYQGEATLASNHGLPVGKHNLTVSVTGQGGEYVNLRGDKWRKFKGELVSNTIEFEIREKTQ